MLGGTGPELVSASQDFQLRRCSALTLEDPRVQGTRPSLGSRTKNSGVHTQGRVGEAASAGTGRAACLS